MSLGSTWLCTWKNVLAWGMMAGEAEPRHGRGGAGGERGEEVGRFWARVCGGGEGGKRQREAMAGGKNETWAGSEQGFSQGYGSRAGGGRGGGGGIEGCGEETGSSSENINRASSSGRISLESNYATCMHDAILGVKASQHYTITAQEQHRLHAPRQHTQN